MAQTGQFRAATAYCGVGRKKQWRFVGKRPEVQSAVAAKARAVWVGSWADRSALGPVSLKREGHLGLENGRAQ